MAQLLNNQNTMEIKSEAIDTQPTRFYIGDSIEPSSVLLDLDQNVNANYVEDVEKIDSPIKDEFDADHVMLSVASLMNSTTKKMSEHNSIDSGYGMMIINGNNRFIPCDSEAIIVDHEEIYPNGNRIINSNVDCHFNDDEDEDEAIETSFNSQFERKLNDNKSSSQSMECCIPFMPDNVKDVCNKIRKSDPIQVLFGVLLSSAGNFLAGLILDRVKNWAVFHQVKQLFYLVPLLLGLKGNLEMTMVARLSTMANTGEIKDWPNTVRIMVRAISLVQCQATLVAIIASTVTMLMMITNGEISGDFQVRTLIVFATSIATANAACFVSSILMMLLVILFFKLHLNPDNFATAVAASFGDVITSGLFGVIGQYIFDRSIYDYGERIPSTVPVESMHELQSSSFAIYIILAFLILFPLFAYFALNDKASRSVLISVSAWTPIFVSMAISFLTGWFLHQGSTAYAFMALYQPLINGIGGNLAAISTSRMSTTLHLRKTSGTDRNPEQHPIQIRKVLRRVIRSFFKTKNQDNKFVWIFVVIAIIVQLVWGIPLAYTSEQSEHMTILFYVFYVTAAALQVFILMVATRFVVHLLWYRGMDPDTCAIPLLTAVGDLLGTVFLLFVFHILFWSGNSAAVGVQMTNEFSTTTTINDLYDLDHQSSSATMLNKMAGVTYQYTVSTLAPFIDGTSPSIIN